jgi:hypothetical protein
MVSLGKITLFGEIKYFSQRDSLRHPTKKVINLEVVLKGDIGLSELNSN